MSATKAKTDKQHLPFHLIPYEALVAEAAVWEEGRRKYDSNGTTTPNYHYGIGDIEFQRERLDHALNHLLLYAAGDRSEDHLSKVAWFCHVQVFYDCREGKRAPLQYHPDYRNHQPVF